MWVWHKLQMTRWSSSSISKWASGGPLILSHARGCMHLRAQRGHLHRVWSGGIGVRHIKSAAKVRYRSEFVGADMLAFLQSACIKGGRGYVHVCVHDYMWGRAPAEWAVRRKMSSALWCDAFIMAQHRIALPSQRLLGAGAAVTLHDP